MTKPVEIGDIVTIKSEVTHFLNNGQTTIGEIRGPAATVGIPESAIATIAKPEKWTPPGDKPAS